MAVKTNQKTYLSWDDIESAVDDLCQQIPFEYSKGICWHKSSTALSMSSQLKYVFWFVFTAISLIYYVLRY